MSMTSQGNAMEKVIGKADVLIEALPYLKKFAEKVFVIKYGGSAMEDDVSKEHILEDLVLLKYIGIYPILVHGGGKKINQLMNKVDKQPDFVNGLRVTDPETMELTEMALSWVNKELVGKINKLGGNAIGISGKDGKLVSADKMGPVEIYGQQETDGGEKASKEKVDLGLVGEVKHINTNVLMNLSQQGYIPVVSPVAGDEQGESLNINADHVAGELAKALVSEKLILMTNVSGIMTESHNEDSLIPELTAKDAMQMISKGQINEGMIPKVEACINALSGGVNRTHIVNGGLKHAMLLEIFTDEGIGTMVKK